jgi:hypothetical protein
MNQRRLREIVTAVVAVATVVVGAAFAVLLPAAPAHAGFAGWGGIGSGSGSFLPLAGGTLSGTVTFNGVATDMTTVGNEDLTLAPAGTGSVVLTSGDKQVDIVGQGGTSKIDVVTSGVLFAFGPVQAGLGATANRTIGQTAAGFYDNAGVNNLFTVDGVGILHMITGVTASNNLVGTAACAAAGNVGDVVLYSDSSTNKISVCTCEQTGAGTFAWGAATATGDCT